MNKKANGWDDDRCKKQAKAIHGWKPWEKATGPRTPEGKAKVAQNAYKGGVRPLIREILKTSRHME